MTRSLPRPLTVLSGLLALAALSPVPRPGEAVAAVSAPAVQAGAPAARLSAAPPAASPAVTSSAEAAGDFQRGLEQWRQQREAELRNPEGWLSLVGLFWLDEGENRFGSDPANRIALPAGRAPAQAGRLVRHGGSIRLSVAPGVAVTSDGKPVSEMALEVGGKKTTVLRLGSLSFFVIQRGDRYGVRVKDSRGPALAAFHGVESFPGRPDWRVVARFEPYRPPRKIPILNVLGQTEEQDAAGAVVFERDGKTYRLDGLGGEGEGLFIVFGDRTNGQETYGAGRFLDTDPPKDGRVVVDFNRAYNPPCAFTPFATCPLPPPQNRLGLRVEAGEKTYGEGHHEEAAGGRD